jgi:hypothetical protein
MRYGIMDRKSVYVLKKLSRGRHIPFVVLIFMIACSGANQKSTHIDLEGGEKPTFKLNGGGSLCRFVVYGPRQREGGGAVAFTVWEIVPTDGQLNGRYLWTLGSIKYGVPPKGYKQIYPENNVSPPLMVENEIYRYRAEIINAPWAVADFKLINGKVVEVKSYTH